MEENPEPRTQNRAYSYRNLLLWEKAQTLALEVIRLTSRLPADPAARILGQQVIRSSSSIGANIAEGHGRFSLAAHRNHLSIAKASACETGSWADLLARAGFISRESERRLHDASEELVRMLTAKIVQIEALEERNRKARKTDRLADERAAYHTEDYLGIDPVLSSEFLGSESSVLGSGSPGSEPPVLGSELLGSES
jgi:four helix bundle protein